MRAYLVLATKRSGHHGVINWIGYQNPNNVLHLNDCNFTENSPFNSLSNDFSVYQKKYASKDVDVSRFDSRDFRDYEYLWKTEKKDFILNFEDKDIDQFSVDNISKCPMLDELRKIYVVVLRDPYNWLASAFRKREGNNNPIYMDSFNKGIAFWKRHAKLCLDPPLHIIVINFNKWHASYEYRQYLCDRLELPFTDQGRTGLFKYGSSFNGMDFNGRADQMDVLNRWETYKDNEIYRMLIDEEMKQYSREYFNFNPF